MVDGAKLVASIEPSKSFVLVAAIVRLLSGIWNKRHLSNLSLYIVLITKLVIKPLVPND